MFEVGYVFVCVGVWLDCFVVLVGVLVESCIVLFCGVYLCLWLEWCEFVRLLIYLVLDLSFLFFGVHFMCYIDGEVFVGLMVLLLLVCDVYWLCDVCVKDFVVMFVWFGILCMMRCFWCIGLIEIVYVVLCCVMVCIVVCYVLVVMLEDLLFGFVGVCV